MRLFITQQQRSSSLIFYAIFNSFPLRYYCAAASAAVPLQKSAAFIVPPLHQQRYLSRKSALYSAKGKETEASSTNIGAVRKLTTTSTSTTSKTAKKKKTSKTKRKMSSKKKSAESQPAFPHAPASIISSNFDQTRTKLLTTSTTLPRSNNDKSLKHPCIIYWMNRDVRTVDNWALLFAQNLAVRYEVPLRVVYTLPPPPPPAEKEDEEGGGDESAPPNPTELSITERHATFLLDGLQIVAKELSLKNVPFDILCPDSRDTVGSTIHSYCTASTHNNDALAVVTDFSPLRLPRTYTEDQATPLLDTSSIPLYQVDAHNIVPVWMASPKREVGARTLRPKINKMFGEYCTQFPEFTGNESVNVGEEEEVKNEIDWDAMRSYLRVDDSISHISSMTAGHTAAMERFHTFCSSKQHGLKNFDALRNDPNFPDVCSNLSPWINYGQVSFQRLALDVRALKRHSNGTAAYIEEGVVRRELSDNYVYYTRDDYGK